MLNLCLDHRCSSVAGWKKLRSDLALDGETSVLEAVSFFILFLVGEADGDFEVRAVRVVWSRIGLYDLLEGDGSGSVCEGREDNATCRVGDRRAKELVYICYQRRMKAWKFSFLTHERKKMQRVYEISYFSKLFAFSG